MNTRTLNTNTQKHKKTFFAAKVAAICGLSLVSITSMAQKGFDFGFLIGAGTTTLINKSDQAAGAELNFKQNISVPFGVTAGYTFNEHTGVEIDAMYSTLGQGYTGVGTATPDPKVFSTQLAGLAAANKIDITGNFNARVALQTVQIPVLFRYTGDRTNKIFFSSYIGPEFNMFNTAVFHINGYEAPPTNYSVQPQNMYNRMTVDGVIGAGAGFNLAPNCVLMTTFRLDYGFQDIENKNLMFSYNGGPSEKYYGTGRGVTNSGAAGVIVTLSYKLVPKAKEAPAKKK